MNIAFIGLGIMGSRMVQNLAAARHTVTVYNRTRSKAEKLAGEHIRAADRPQEAVAEADVVITMLSDPEAVRTMAVSESGFLHHMAPESIWMDCTTVNPSFSKEMAAHCRRYGVHFLDAPVAGSKAPAERGELLFLVGGDPSTVKRCEPLFEAMGKNYLHLGGHGMGASMKMVFNLLLGQAMYAFAEGLVLGESLGLNRQTLMNVLSDAPVTAPFLKTKAQKIAAADFDTEFPLQWMQKDLQLAAQSGYEQATAMPATNVIKEMYALAANQEYAFQDFSAVYAFLKKMNDREEEE